jgi:hypothetical protein
VSATFIVGIDLGTTNSALTSIDPSRGAASPVVDLPVPQLVRPGELAERSLLPSCVYLPGERELPEGALALPWDGAAKAAVGEFARWQGAKVPGRLVASAKSWLAHPGVDRQAPILPWGAPADVARISPVEASARVLEHLASAWERAHPGAPLSQQEVVITVPASFDEAARALTVSAARKAGLERFTLLEEPQAAFYDFTSRHRTDLAAALGGARLVLVVDVGGGTTDFTLVRCEALPEGIALRRIAVGDHLMLGGDNMDAALAHLLEARMSSTGRLPAQAWSQLVHQARMAKEALLSAKPPEKFRVAIAGTGSKLVGGALSAELSLPEVEAALVEGFMPAVTADDVPRRAARVGLQELGLPYANDPAVTRHLVAFLRQHAAAGWAALGAKEPSGLPRPDALLLNGGVFNSPRLAARLVEAVSALWPTAPKVRVLEHGSLELSVARGAAYYGLTRRGLGRRIGGGAARAYYVGLGGEGAGKALCLIPRGFEEGESAALTERAFTLALGRPVQFQLFSTTDDRIDKPGELVDLAESFKPLPPIHTVLSGATKGPVPVRLRAALTEIGTLELSAESESTAERWRLEFELRGEKARRELVVTEAMSGAPARFAEAVEAVQKVFGNKPMPVAPRDVKQLGRELERVLGPRDGWRLPILRELWSALFAGAVKRRRSPEHERVFFQLTGFTLRPGAGYPLDEWRCAQTFRLFDEKVTNHREAPVWAEFWVMWRRLAGGLTEAQQRHVYGYLREHLEQRVPPDAPKPKEKQKGIRPEGLDEMVRAAAAFENLEPADKVQLGGWVSRRLESAPAGGGPWAWALGRLGARAPLHGSVHQVVPPEAAACWLELLLRLGLANVDGSAFAAALIARRTGDRARDLDEALLGRCRDALVAAKASDSWVRLVTEVTLLEAADEARALGDSLPAGLSL